MIFTRSKHFTKTAPKDDKMENIVLKQDIEGLIDDCNLYECFENKTILVTGATGLIGSLIVKSFLAYAEKSKKKIKLIAVVRDRKKAIDIFRDYLSDFIDIVELDIVSKEINFEEKVDYIFHCASRTASKDFVEKPVETIETAIYGTNNILKFANKKQVKAMVYLSSLEVYGIPQLGDEVSCLDEKQYKYLDPMEVRSSYSEGKRMVENLCVSYSVEYNVPVKIARLTQTFGAGINYNDTRVFAEFARCAVEGKDIVLYTKGETVRNYCYTIDAIRALLYIALYGKNREAYNVANEDTAISIYELAKRMSNCSQKKIKVVIDENNNLTKMYNPVMKVTLNNAKLKLLGWSSSYSLEEMIKRTFDWMESSKGYLSKC